MIEHSIPDSWMVVPLGDILVGTIGGGTPNKSVARYFDGSIPWLTIKDMRTRRPTDTIDHISEDAVADSATNIIPPDTVIVATRVGLGKVVRVPYATAINQDLRALLTPRDIDKSFLEYWVVRNASQIEAAGRGTTVKGIRIQQLVAFRFVLPPLPEQHRIVEAIESYLSRLDAAVAALERVKKNLERYRASVLKAAVEGRLVPTEAELARKEGRDYEPASVLLERILRERRARWEAAEWDKLIDKAKQKAAKARRKKAGNPLKRGEKLALDEWQDIPEDEYERYLPKNDKWKEKYKEPAAPDTSELPELPEGWCWATIEQLESGDRKCGYGVLVPGQHLDDGVPFIRVGDIDGGHIRRRGLKRISRDVADRFSKTYLQGGEVLLTLVGTVGRTAVVSSAYAGANIARAVGMIPSTNLVEAHWIMIWFMSTETRQRMVGLAHEVARKTLNLEDVRSAYIALPPRSEQKRIRNSVDGLDSITDALKSSARHSMDHCVRLRQSILKWAFEGKLVDQDPNDEPASVLLERIKAEREALASRDEKNRARRPRRRRTS